MLLTSALLGLLTWAAATGPDELLHGRGPTPSRELRLPAQPDATPSPTPTPAPSGPAHLDPATYDVHTRWTSWVVVAALLAVLAWLGYRLLRRLWTSWRDREVAPADPDEVAFEPLTPAALAETVVDDAPAQRRLLAEGTPRNGIVRCWDRFEQLAATAGLARAEWETAAELTLRFFDVLEADAHPVQRLAELYREARFSDHRLGEPERHAAAEALDAIHASLLAQRRGVRG